MSAMVYDIREHPRFSIRRVKGVSEAPPLPAINSDDLRAEVGRYIRLVLAAFVLQEVLDLIERP